MPLVYHAPHLHNRGHSGTSVPVSRLLLGVLGTGSLAPADAPPSRTPSVCRSKNILTMHAVAKSKEVVGPPAKVLIKPRNYAYAPSDLPSWYQLLGIRLMIVVRDFSLPCRRLGLMTSHVRFRAPLSVCVARLSTW